MILMVLLRTRGSKCLRDVTEKVCISEIGSIYLRYGLDRK